MTDLTADLTRLQEAILSTSPPLAEYVHEWVRLTYHPENRAEILAALAERDALRAEVERLWERFERIAMHDPTVPGLRYDSERELLNSLIAIARAALEGADHD